jgi:hypothetical protein
MIRIVRLVAFAALLATSIPAAAQEDNDVIVAAETFRAGEQAYARGDYEVAARSFEVSHRLAPHPNAIYNAALAWLAAEKRAAAADAFATALAMDGLTPEQRADAEAKLAEVSRTLTLVQIIGPEGTQVTLGHAEKRVTPASIHVVAGHHDLAIVYPDGRSEKRGIDALGDGKELAIELAIEPPAPVPAPRPKRGVPLPEPEPVEDEGVGGTWIAGFALAGLGVVGAAVAIGVGAAALGARDTFDESGHTDADAHDRAASLRTGANVAWALAGAAGVTGVILLIVSATSDDGGDDAALRVDAGPLGVRVSGHF